MVSFTTTFVSAIAVFSIAQPIMAGGIIKSFLGKRDLTVRSPEAFQNSVVARGLTEDFNACLKSAKETMKIAKEGTASFKISASGKMPPACITVATSYMKSKQTDGQLTKNADGSYTLHPNAKDVPALLKLVDGK